MSRARKGSAPAVLYTLTGEQATLLRAAADKAPRGVYVPIMGSAAAGQLVDGGAAEYREVRQTGGTRSAQDARPCEWTDLYLVPTARGIEMLKKHVG